MKTVAKVFSGALLAGVAFAAPVQAQVSFFTQGFFSGGGATCNTTPGFLTSVMVPLGATCTLGNFTLLFTPEQGDRIGDMGISSLGNFTLTGSGMTTAPSTLFFTIAIRQTLPTVGTGFTDGFISGSVRTSPPGNDNFSSLIFIPDQFVNIDATTYRLIFDNVGPAANIGLGIPINATRGIQVQISTVPEPASMALLATGLVGVFGVARRRRSKQIA